MRAASSVVSLITHVMVVVAALWSVVLVGIPVLIRLFGRNVRRSFGVD